MKFGEAIQHCLSNYANFSGRARRSEYWYFCLFNFLVGSILRYLGDEVAGFFSYFGYLYSLAILVPCLAVCWRRLHDTGRSGLRYLFVLIPLVGAILLLVWCCQDSQRGDNQYGPNPKGDYPGGNYGSYPGSHPDSYLDSYPGSYLDSNNGEYNGGNNGGYIDSSTGKPPWEY